MNRLAMGAKFIWSVIEILTFLSDDVYPQRQDFTGFMWILLSDRPGLDMISQIFTLLFVDQFASRTSKTSWCKLLISVYVRIYKHK